MISDDKSAAIFGYGGQDGSLLWAHLAAQGYRLHGVGRTGRRDSVSTATDEVPAIGDRAALKRYFADVGPHEVYYLAAYHRSSEARDSGNLLNEWEPTFAVNTQGFLNVLDALREVSPQTRVFYAASSHIFRGDDAKPLDEETPIFPAGFYGIAKAAGVQLAHEYRVRHKLHVSTGILFNHESHLRSRNFLSRKVIDGAREIRDGRRTQIELGDLDAVVDWSYAGDFVSGFQATLLQAPPDEYVFASGIGHTVREFVQIAFDCFGLDWEKHVIVNPSRLTALVPRRVGNPARIFQRTGWKTKHGLESMIQTIVRNLDCTGS
jgi:GDPmannose 4,6-dehydratase